MVDVPNNGELAQAIRWAAKETGLDPVDIGTAISYETGGTFNPTIKGPTTKWGTHRGLFQAGEPQAEKYFGNDFSVPSQMRGLVAYLKDAGVKPGMGLLDIYSAINAGQVGKYGASDAAAGGAPGTVADKVRGMAAHRLRAEVLLNGKLPAGYSMESKATSAAPAAAVAGGAPFGLAPQQQPDIAPLIEAAQGIASSAQADPFEVKPPAQIDFSMLHNMRRRLSGGMA